MTKVEKELTLNALERLLGVQETTGMRIVDMDELRGAIRSVSATEFAESDPEYTEDDLPPWKNEPSIADMADHMADLYKAKSEPTEKQKTIALMAAILYSASPMLLTVKIASQAQELYDEIIKQTNNKKG